MTIGPINNVPSFISDRIVHFLDDRAMTLLRRVSTQFKAIIDHPKWESYWRDFTEKRFSHLKPMFQHREEVGMKLFLECAKIERKVNLASYHERGIGTPVNRDEAFKYFKKAAEQGYVPAKQLRM
jgi:TPR repeat protein